MNQVGVNRRAEPPVGRQMSLGAPPDLSNIPPGCAFAPLCSFVSDIYRKDVPPPIAIDDTHFARCVLVAEAKMHRFSALRG